MAKASELTQEQISRIAQIDTYSYIIASEAENLTFDDAVEILTRVARKKRYRAWIHSSGDGTNIRLDKLSENMIITIFNFMKEKLGLEHPAFSK